MVERRTRQQLLPLRRSALISAFADRSLVDVEPAEARKVQRRIEIDVLGVIAWPDAKFDGRLLVTGPQKCRRRQNSAACRRV